MTRIAYFFSTFPALSTTFVQHQVSATLNLNLDAILISTRSPAPKGFHPHDEHFYKDTIYLDKISFFCYLKKNLKALILSPISYFKAILVAFRLNDDFPWQRTRNFMHLLGAAVLTDILKKEKALHIHVHFAFGAAGVALFSNVLSGITYSLTIHGSDVLLPRPLTKEKLKRAKFVVSNCMFHINNLRNRYPSLESKRFYIVRGGLELYKEQWSVQTLPEFQGKLNILTVARLEPVKAIDILIEACAILKRKGVDFQCKIAGDGPERKRLENLIENFELSKNIDLLGSCYQDEVIKLYEWSHVVVLSSLSEGTPMTIIEAMAKARPVIVPDITALPEMVINKKNGYRFKKASYIELASQLLTFIEKPDTIESMGCTGRRYAEENFDLNKNAAHLVNIFGREIPALCITDAEEDTNE